MIRKLIVFLTLILIPFFLYSQNTHDILADTIIGVYRFKEFRQFDFNSKGQSPRQNMMSKTIFEEHFSDGAIIVGYENKEKKYYIQYSYPKYVKEYFEIDSPIVSGKIITGYIDDFFEYQISNDNIIFSFNRINERETDEYKNLLISSGVFEKIDVIEYGIYSYMSHRIVNELGDRIDIEKIAKAEVKIYKVKDEESYVVYFNNPNEEIKIVDSLRGTFISYIAESRSSHEYRYYFNNGILKLFVKDFLYQEETQNTIHEYTIDFRSNNPIIL